MGLFRRVGPAAAAVLCLVGCSGGGGTRPSSAPPRTTSTPTPAPAGCTDDSIANTGMGPELRGSGDGVTLYGLVMVTKPLPVRVGEDVKIVWRMTGAGPLTLSATGPRGVAGTLQWGPEPHGGSNYDRPGEEWGAGYRFTTPGCWRLHAERTRGSADAWLMVRA
jgi:hypothetical protein